MKDSRLTSPGSDHSTDKSAEPVFVVGTGRNGTRSIFRMLRGNERIDAHHEYGCENIQKIACLYSMNLIDLSQAVLQVKEHYAAAINYCRKPIWLDSSNKASWIIEPLKEAFPRSRFIHITRDPRRVVPSYYYKLREEMYDDQSVQALAQWIDSGCLMEQAPPKEKKYWWRLELNKDSNVSPVEYQRTRIERCCLHWSEATRVITDSFSRLEPSSHLTLRLEDLISKQQVIQVFLSFLGLNSSSFFYDFLRKPRNVFLPLEFNCTQSQHQTLIRLCEEQAKNMGYSLEAPVPAISY